MRRVAWALIVTTVLGVGCSGDEASPGGYASSTTTTTARASTLARGARYVALGSSIASGFGISEQSTSCGRSSRSYPRLVAAELALELVDMTCGAAQIRHVVKDAQGDNPVQMSAVTPDTKLITLTVAGNDIGYNATALGCGDPAAVCSAPPTLDADLDAARSALSDLLSQLEARAADATVVLMTYPREVSETGNCPALSLTDEEVDIVRDMGERLQQLFLEVAEGHEVVLVDPYSEPGDHTGCAAEADRWVAGNVADDGFAYHPTALGHRVMADMVLDALRR